MYDNCCRLYKDFVLEVAVVAVLGQKAELQKGEGKAFVEAINLSSDAVHGRLGKITRFILANEFRITCEC